MIVIDFEKLPRPDRHGGLGVFVAVSLLWWMISPLGGSSDLVCGMMPWKCTKQAQSDGDTHVPSYRVHYLTFAPASQSRRKAAVNVCHYDMKNRDGSVWHFLSTEKDAFWIEGDVPDWRPVEYVGVMRYVYCEPPDTGTGTCTEYKLIDEIAYKMHCRTEKNLCNPRPHHYFDDCLVVEK